MSNESIFDLNWVNSYNFIQILLERVNRNISIKRREWKPQFQNKTQNLDWKIAELPERLQNRKLDLGDVSPANTHHFVDALYSDVNGIQVDFDDGHCPTWRNTVLGLYNVKAAVHSTLVGGPDNIKEAPILMLRPRAFNMIEHHCMVERYPLKPSSLAKIFFSR